MKNDELLFERITELVSLLSRPYEKITIRRIAALTGTSPEQTRQDLSRLHRCGIRLTPVSAAERLSAKDDRFDRVPFSMIADLPPFAEASAGLLYLTPVERSFFARKKVIHPQAKDFHSLTPDIISRRGDAIAEAILKRCHVRFRYRASDSEPSTTVVTAPSLLIFNATDDVWYCIALTDHDPGIEAYRLDRMLFDVHIETGKKAPPVDPDDPRLVRLSYVWGSDFFASDEPAHVKIRVESDEEAVLARMRSDLATRPNARLYREDGRWFYEDDIIGLFAFRSWVLFFGPAIKVLEPDDLAAEILEASRMQLLNYEDGLRFHEGDDSGLPPPL